MATYGKMTMEPSGLNEIVMARRFDCSPAQLYDAFTQPEIVKRWMLGPGDTWSLPVCEIDLREGGKMRYEWRSEAGEKMGLSGTVMALEPPTQMIYRELFDDDWTGGETTVFNFFHEDKGTTLHTMIIRYQTPEARDEVLKSGMGEGLEAGYQKLEQLLETVA